MRTLALLLSVLGIGACSSLSSSPPSAGATSARWQCARTMDASVPGDTAFPFVVPYELEPSDTREGDAITITDVRGSSRAMGVGAMYLVRGTYTLASAESARLGLFVTATRAGEGCTNSNGRDARAITRGSGSFDLATRVAYEGRPHVSFYVAGQGTGGVYFHGRTGEVVD